jgi:phosphoglycolate phosphatase-like HAD superfamily hydrolase
MSLMMMKTNPITPPPEVVDRLFMIEGSEEDRIIAAYRAGADQELEACCEWLEKDLDAYELVGLRAVYLDHNLHAARRPKPPSLKKQALEALEALPTPAGQVTADRLDTIRRALEALDD